MRRASEDYLFDIARGGWTGGRRKKEIPSGDARADTGETHLI